MWIDLSWPIMDGMPVYPGDRATKLTQEKWLEADHYNAFRLDTGLHAGTHMDAPLHLLDNAQDMTATLLSRCFAQGILLDVRGHKQIEKTDLPKGFLYGKAVLLYTGMEAWYGQDRYYHDHPIVSMELAHFLAEEGIAFLGMDMPSPDQPPFPVHKLLLGAGIPIVENMVNLGSLRDPFDVACFPLNIVAEASPVRAAAKLFT